MTNKEYVTQATKKTAPRPTFIELRDRAWKAFYDQNLLYTEFFRAAELKRQFDRSSTKVKKRRTARFWMNLRRAPKQYRDFIPVIRIRIVKK